MATLLLLDIARVANFTATVRQRPLFCNRRTPFAGMTISTIDVAGCGPRNRVTALPMSGKHPIAAF